MLSNLQRTNRCYLGIKANQVFENGAKFLSKLLSCPHRLFLVKINGNSLESSSPYQYSASIKEFVAANKLKNVSQLPMNIATLQHCNIATLQHCSDLKSHHAEKFPAKREIAIVWGLIKMRVNICKVSTMNSCFF